MERAFGLPFLFGFLLSLVAFFLEEVEENNYLHVCLLRRWRGEVILIICVSLKRWWRKMVVLKLCGPAIHLILVVHAFQGTSKPLLAILEIQESVLASARKVRGSRVQPILYDILSHSPIGDLSGSVLHQLAKCFECYLEQQWWRWSAKASMILLFPNVRLFILKVVSRWVLLDIVHVHMVLSSFFEFFVSASSFLTRD
ncbi:UNVERIFIED_CONTAM: hypothetical protein Sangu_0174300 [Sesamum angustifolium]|uniref:Uncharacterized protein n=1 Tax=Sesamum angustifolium TaxID=2727405 RepID=A0AAW2RM53_9LAMI